MIVSAEGKKAINTYVPLAAAGAAGYMAYRRNTGWKILVVVILATWFITWLISRNTLKLAEAAGVKPAEKPIDPQQGGYLPSGFNPDEWAFKLFEDLDGASWATHKLELYSQVMKMNDSQLIAINNAFNRRYYSVHGESLAQMIEDDLFAFWTDARKLEHRLKDMGLY